MINMITPKSSIYYCPPEYRRVISIWEITKSFRLPSTREDKIYPQYSKLMGPIIPKGIIRI